MALAQIELLPIQRAVLLTVALLVGACSSEPTPGPSDEITSSAPSAVPTIVAVRPSPTTVQPVGTEPWGPFRRTGIDNRPEPDPALTPGATNPAVTQANIGRTICVTGYTTKVRPPEWYTEGLKSRQIRQYGYADRRLSRYEEDHLIPLELGGAPTSAKNLWPEPHDARLPDGTQAGSDAKDGLENELHARVCDGSISLAAAQHEFATDWVRYWIAAGKP